MSMKKFTVLLFAATAMLSCVNEMRLGGEPADEGKEIVMCVAAEAPETRATPYTATNLNGKSFTMHVYHTNSTDVIQSSGASYGSITGASVTSGGVASITPAGSYKWPVNQSDKLNFFAYYYQGSTAPTVAFPAASQQMNVSYTVNGNSNSHSDLLLAQTKPAWGSTVSIHFYHALTQLTFQVTASGFTETVKINSITMKDALTTGSMTPATIASKAFGTWALSNKASVTNTLATPVTVTTNTVVGDSFLMLPMTKAQFTANTTKLVISYTVGTTNKSYEVALDTLKNDDASKTDHSWIMGNHYNYKLTLKPNEALSILTVSVESWGDVIDVPIEM